jgi:hypothetical protein
MNASSCGAIWPNAGALATAASVMPECCADLGIALPDCGVREPYRRDLNDARGARVETCCLGIQHDRIKGEQGVE